MAYHTFHALDTRIVRIFNTYGPRMRLDDGRVVPSFIGSVLRGEPLTVYGEGQQTRSFCFVSDLVEGIFRLLCSEKAGPQPVNIGTEFELTILEFAKLILELSGSSESIEYRPLPKDDPKSRRPDLTRARSVLGYEPQVELQDGLKRTIKFFQEQTASKA